MSCRTYLWFSGTIFGVVAALHVLRLVNGWPFQVGPFILPVVLSWAGVAACGWSVSLGLSSVSSGVGVSGCYVDRARVTQGPRWGRVRDSCA